MAAMEPYVSPAYSDDLASASAMADGLRQSLRLARALAGQNRPVELEGMQDGIGLLCAKALDLAPGEGRLFRIALLALREELDQLSATLRAVAPE
jgi:hypothetical protein